jgi:hypothetical protein
VPPNLVVKEKEAIFCLVPVDFMMEILVFWLELSKAVGIASRFVPCEGARSSGTFARFCDPVGVGCVLSSTVRGCRR